LRSKVFRRSLILILIIAVVSASSTILASTYIQMSLQGYARARSIIMFLPDGAGFSHIIAARLVKGQPLLFEEFPYRGFFTTFSLDAIVTDSAAAASAFATGFKVKNRMLSTTPDGRSLKTILEVAKDLGKSVGLITTSEVVDASPAALGAHAKSRDMYNEIAEQYIGKVDVILGGGRRYFLPKLLGGVRDDGKNLVELAKKLGYEYVENREELLSLDLSKVDKLLGLFEWEDLPYEIDRVREYYAEVPSLAEMTAVAIEILSKDPDGFFLFVETEVTDEAAHDNDIASVVYDLLALEKAVRVALDFAEKNPDTLIIVLADHETGGLTITSKFDANKIRFIKASVGYMTDLIVKGKNITEVLLDYTGIVPTMDEVSRIEKAVNDYLQGKLTFRGVIRVISPIINKYVGVIFASTEHSAEPVPIFAKGPNAELVKNVKDNTDVFHFMLTAYLGKPSTPLMTWSIIRITTSYK